MQCGLDRRSVVVDVGSGLGRPLLHAVVSHGCRGALGIELDPVKTHKARHLCRETLRRLDGDGIDGHRAAPTLVWADVGALTALGPCTHAYSFWEGVPPTARRAFGRLFASSSTLHTLTVVQRGIRGVGGKGEGDRDNMVDNIVARTLTRDAAFPAGLELIDDASVAMSGSGRRFRAYTLRRTDWEARAVRANGASDSDVAAGLGQVAAMAGGATEAAGGALMASGRGARRRVPTERVVAAEAGGGKPSLRGGKQAPPPASSTAPSPSRSRVTAPFEPVPTAASGPATPLSALRRGPGGAGTAVGLKATSPRGVGKASPRPSSSPAAPAVRATRTPRRGARGPLFGEI